MLMREGTKINLGMQFDPNYKHKDWTTNCFHSFHYVALSPIVTPLDMILAVLIVQLINIPWR